MAEGIYETEDPNVRIRVMFDNDPPVNDPGYGPGVYDSLLGCYRRGDYYGVIVLHMWSTKITRTNEATGESTQDVSTSWSPEDSVWGCAGYKDEVACEVALEHFNIKVTGKLGE